MSLSDTDPVFSRSAVQSASVAALAAAEPEGVARPAGAAPSLAAGGRRWAGADAPKQAGAGEEGILAAAAIPQAGRYLPGANAVRGGALLAGLALASFAQAWALDVCGILLGGLLVLAALDWRALRAAQAWPQVSRQLPTCAGRGVPFVDQLQVRNAGVRPLRIWAREVLPDLAGGEHCFAPFTLPPGDGAVLEARVCLPRRGKYVIGGLWLRLAGRFGVIDWQREFCPGAALKVYPESLVTRDELKDQFGAQLTEKMKRRQRRGEGMEFESLSAFQTGDDVRHIDWRASARHRSLLVRRHQIEQHRDVVILLDAGRLMGTDAGADRGSKLDQAVNSALLLMEVAVGRGDRCGFGVFDDRVLHYQPPLGGSRARQAILEQVYAVQSEYRESNFALMFSLLQSRQRKRALVVVLSDLVDGATSDRFRAALASLAKTHVVVFAALRTPLLEGFAREEVEDFGGVCRKAVALRLERERERTLRTLDHTGVRVIDADPRELTAPLINSYLTLRAGNLL